LSSITNGIQTFLKKSAAYKKAYSGNIFWPLMLPLRQLQLRQIAKRAALFLESGLILDIGTGYGYLCVEMARLRPKAHIIGVDIQLELLSDGIKYAVQKGRSDQVAFLRANAEFLPFADNTFDMVLSTMSLHLWRDKQQGIVEIQRVLKPGGQTHILVGSYFLVRGLARITDQFTKKSTNILVNLLATAAFREFKVDYRDSILAIVATK
jgi:ubiquinone/menaquinone biosynthesis C-methylase UbiE